MEFQMRSIVLYLSLSFLIHTQLEAVSSFKQASFSSVDLKHHHLTIETTSFPVDLARRQLAGGGGSSGGGGGGSGGSRGGSSGGSSSGGSSRGGGGGGTSGGGSSNRGGSGGSGGNKGGKGGGGRGGGSDGGDDGDSGGGGGGNSGNTRGGSRQAPIIPGGRFPSDGVQLQYSLVLIIFMTCLVIMY